MLRPSPNHGTQRLPNDDDDVVSDSNHQIKIIFTFHFRIAFILNLIHNTNWIINFSPHTLED